MCYDISFKVEIAELSDYFPDLIFDEQIKIDFDAAIHIVGQLYGNHPIIYASQDDGALHCRLMEWGCIPHYVTDVEKFQPQRKLWLNSRSEKIFGEEKSYWKQIKNRRCLIPVSGFYEHRAVAGWKKKVPYLIQVKDQSTFFLPGLYAVVQEPNRETGEILKRWTFSILTRSAIGNSVMMNIHNDGENKFRMPLILPFDLAKEWVQKELPEDRYREIVNYQMPAENLNYKPVFTIRSPKPRPDNKAKDEYWEWEKLPELGIGNPV